MTAFFIVAATIIFGALLGIVLLLAREGRQDEIDQLLDDFYRRHRS